MGKLLCKRGGSRAHLFFVVVGATALLPASAKAVVSAEMPGVVLSRSADKGPSGSPERHRTFGLTMDLGAPDGAALGLVVRPQLEWLRLAAAATHNGFAPGARFGVTLDPIAFPIAPTLTIEGGHAWEGTSPFLKNSPAIGYSYANFHFGVEVGSRSAFRFFLRGGASWVDFNASHLDPGSSSAGSPVLLGNPSFSGWVAPSGKLGFATYF